MTSAQGMEARQGGDGSAGSVHDSLVPARGCARRQQKQTGTGSRMTVPTVNAMILNNRGNDSRKSGSAGKRRAARQRSPSLFHQYRAAPGSVLLRG
ncbi:hypothetical protein GSB46_005278 [Salmonella enterica]|nr:hypothetical protein [Salmonella enterica]